MYVYLCEQKTKEEVSVDFLPTIPFVNLKESVHATHVDSRHDRYVPAYVHD